MPLQIRDMAWEKLLADGHPPLRVMRHVFRALPSEPRCKFCNSPFGGVGGRLTRVAGFRPSRKNPTMCTRCDEQLGPGGAETDIAVLFADVRGSTALGAGMEATPYAQLLNRFYATATDVLIRHDAIIDKLIGDEVMALFIRGMAGPDYRWRAVEAGVDLLREVDPALAIGVGVNAGTAYVGNVGPEGLTDFTALGDPINLAARLQSHAAAGQLVVAEDVHNGLAAQFPDADRRELELRGREAPMPARIVQVART
jgi:adenylate cyclase